MAVRAHCMAVARDPTSGAALLAATVNVYNPGTVTPISATIFDKSGNPLSNPLTSDATTGLIDFYLGVAQEVDLVVAKAGFTTRTYSNVPVLDDASNDLTALLTTTGDIAYASSANTPARLGIGSASQVLSVVGGVPAWGTVLATVSASNSGGAFSVTNSIADITGATLTLITGGVYIVLVSVFATDTSAATNSLTVTVADGANTAIFAPIQTIIASNNAVLTWAFLYTVGANTTLKLRATGTSTATIAQNYGKISAVRIG